MFTIRCRISLSEGLLDLLRSLPAEEHAIWNQPDGHRPVLLRSGEKEGLWLRDAVWYWWERYLGSVRSAKLNWTRRQFWARSTILPEESSLEPGSRSRTWER